MAFWGMLARIAGETRYRLCVASLVVIGVVLAAAPSVSAQNAYISNSVDGTVSVINTTTGTVTATIQVGQQPGFLAISPDGTKVYVNNTLDQTISVIDVTANQVVSTFTPPQNTTGPYITPDGSQLYFFDNDGTATVLDANTLAVDRTISFLTGASSIVFSPDGTRGFVSEGSFVAVIDTQSGAVLSTTAYFSGVQNVIISPDGAKLYVISNGGTVFVVDTATNTIIGSFGSKNVVILSPDGARAYSAYSVNNSTDSPGSSASISYYIAVVDTATDAVVSTLTLAGPTYAMALTPDGKQLYVESLGGSTITVVDPLTGGFGLVPTVNVGGGTDSPNNFIGPVPSPLVAAMLPGGRTVQAGTPATVFGTMINSSSTALQNCHPSLMNPSGAGITLAYQTTNPTTNAPVGQANTPVTIAGEGTQSFVLAFSDSSALTADALPIKFQCDGVTEAPILVGVDTVDLTFSATPIPDIVALSATSTGDGIITIPVNGEGAFAVATSNVGAGASLTASVEFGGVRLPLNATICQSNPANAQCLTPPAVSVPVTIAAGATPTFSVFATALDFIPFAPASSRIFVRFSDSSGAQHGSTSVAVKTDAIDPHNPPIPGPTYAGSLSGSGELTGHTLATRNFICNDNDSYTGTITVSFSPDSVKASVSVSGSWVRQLPNGSNVSCLSGFTTSLSQTTQATLSGSTISWVTLARDPNGGSLELKFSGTLSAGSISGTLVETEPEYEGSESIPIALPVASQ